MTLSAFRALSESDQLLALGLDMYEADLCPGCGQSRTYAHDGDSEKHWHAPDATRCHACTALEAKRRKYDESSSKNALYFRVEPDDALVYAMEHPLPLGGAPARAEPPPDTSGPDHGDD